MEWDDLRIFQAAVRIGDYSNAARTLGIDRTTVGRRFARLERAIGAELWQQTPAGYRPTEVGSAVLRAAAAMERAMARLQSELATTVSGRVRLAGTAGIAQLLLPRIAPLWAGNTGLQVEMVGVRDAVAAIRQRQADLGVAIQRGKPQQMAAIRLAPYRQALYERPGGNGGRIGWNHAQALASPEGWARLNDGAGTVCEVDTLSAMHDAVRAGIGRAWLWRRMADAEPGLSRIDADPPATADAWLWLVHRDDVPAEAGTAALRDLLATALRDTGE